MRSGPLRDRIEIHSIAETPDTGGAVVLTPTLVATVYAQVLPLSGRERIAADQTESRVSHRIRMRYYDGLTSKHRLKIAGSSRTFEILAVTNPDGRKVEHLVDVTEAA